MDMVMDMVMVTETQKPQKLKVLNNAIAAI